MCFQYTTFLHNLTPLFYVLITLNIHSMIYLRVSHYSFGIFILSSSLLANYLHHITKIGKLKYIALIKRQRSQRTSKKNSYKKTLHHFILNTTDETELIHNLSNMYLSPSHIHFLSKGLGCIPTPTPTSIQEIDSAFQPSTYSFNVGTPCSGQY